MPQILRHLEYLMWPKIQKQSKLNLIGRIIPQSEGANPHGIQDTCKHS